MYFDAKPPGLSAGMFWGLNPEGRLGAECPSVGLHGPGLIGPDVRPGDEAKLFRVVVVTVPPGLTSFDVDELGAVTADGSDGAHVGLKEGYADGASYGQAPFTLVFGAALYGSATLDDVSASGTLGSAAASTLSGSATLDDVGASGTLGVAGVSIISGSANGLGTARSTSTGRSAVSPPSRPSKKLRFSRRRLIRHH